MKSRIVSIIGFLILSAFIALSISVWLNPFPHFLDQKIYDFFSQWIGPRWLWINELVSFLGQGEPLFSLAVIVTIYLLVRGYTREGIWYFLTLSIGMQMNVALKVFFERERPEALGTAVWPSYSYPSGHSLGAVIFYLLTWWVLAKINPDFSQKKIFLIFVCLLVSIIGVTRVTLGAHWVTDVIGGFSLGLSWFFFNIWFAERNYFFGKQAADDG